MIFQIPKSLLLDALSIIAPVMAKSTNPQEKSQYLVMKTEGKNLTLLITGQEYTAKVVIDERAVDQKLLTIETDGVYIAQADVILALMAASDIRDMISLDFKPSKGEIIKTDDPSTPLAKLGVLTWKFPGKEVHSMPCIDTQNFDVPTKPEFDLSGKNKLRVPSEEFLSILTKVGMAAGVDGGDAKFRNVLIRTEPDMYELITTDSAHLAWGKMTPKHCSGKYSIIAPYRCMLIGARVSATNYEGDIEIVHNQGNFDTVVMTRDMLCGDKPVGKVYFRTSCANESFANFEKLIKNLDFVCVCKAKTQQLKAKLPTLAIAKPHKMKVSINAKESLATFAKAEKDRIDSHGIPVPITIVKGGDFEFEISFEHLSESVCASTEDEIEWSFSGKTSLTQMRLSPELNAYFTPYTE